ncbi:MAG: hypothetical protein WCI77_07685 [Candidatus Omnitrophota bacterium]
MAERSIDRRQELDARAKWNNAIIPAAGTTYEVRALVKGKDRDQVFEQTISSGHTSLQRAEEKRAEALDRPYYKGSHVAIFMEVNNELKQVLYWDPAIKPLYRIGSYDTLYEVADLAARLRLDDYKMIAAKGWDRDPNVAGMLAPELKIYSVDGDGMPMSEADIAFEVFLKTEGIHRPKALNIFHYTNQEAEDFVSREQKFLPQGQSLRIRESIFFNPLPENFSYPD